MDFGCQNGSQIETRRGSRHVFRCVAVTDGEKEGSGKVCSCIINIAKMQFDCENICVFEDFDFVTVVGIAYHLSSRRLEKHSEIGVQDIPKPCQNALRYQLHVGSASRTALERFWTPT